jgi:DnaJ-class molecular chaperone
MTNDGPVEDDYYRILGVLRTAAPEEITAAYHVLARKYHPDVAKSDPDTLGKLKLVNQAYEVLSDEGKRRAYDRQRRSKPRVVPTANPAGGEVRVSRILATEPGTRRPRVSPADIEVEVPIAPEEAILGGPCEVTLHVPRTCTWCGGGGSYFDGVCGLCQGRGRIREHRSLRFFIPPHTQSGTVLRIIGQGKRTGASPGDLFVRLKIQASW